MRSRSFCAPGEVGLRAGDLGPRLPHVLDARAGQAEPELGLGQGAIGTGGVEGEAGVGRVDPGQLLAGGDRRALRRRPGSRWCRPPSWTPGPPWPRRDRRPRSGPGPGPCGRRRPSPRPRGGRQPWPGTALTLRFMRALLCGEGGTAAFPGPVPGGSAPRGSGGTRSSPAWGTGRVPAPRPGGGPAPWRRRRRGSPRGRSAAGADRRGRKSPSRAPRSARRRDTPMISRRWGSTAGSIPVESTSRRKRVGKPGRSRVTCVEGPDVGVERLAGVDSTRLDRLQPLGHRGEGRLQDRHVEPALAPEVVADEGLVDARAVGDLLDRDPVEPPLGEQLRAGPEQGLPRGLGVPLLPHPLALVSPDSSSY